MEPGEFRSHIRFCDLKQCPSGKLHATLNRAGVSFKTPSGQADRYAFRHTCLTWLSRSGAPIETVQAVARHATASMTLGAYLHSSRERERAAIRGLPDVTAAHGAAAKTGTRDTEDAALIGEVSPSIRRQENREFVNARAENGLQEPRQGFRILSRKGWGFDSPRPHHTTRGAKRRNSRP